MISYTPVSNVAYLEVVAITDKQTIMIEIKTLEIAGMASVLQALRLPTIQPIIYEVDNKVIVMNLDRRIGVYLILINGKKYVGSTSVKK